MKLLRKAGATSEIWQIFIRDSSSTTGAGLTGLTSASAGLTAYYHRDTDTTATAISLVTMTVGTFTSSGFKEVDATNMPGLYQFCPPNAALASGAKSCAFLLKGATNMAPLPIEVDLDGQVDVALWNGTAVAAPATAGYPVVTVKVGAGTGEINASGGKVPATLASTDVTGNVAADVQTIKTQTVTCAAGVTVSSNVGTTQPVNFTGTAASALVKSDMVDIAGAVVNTSTAQIGVNVIQSAGTTVHNSDGTLASATATTVTFPTTDSAGNTIPDDARYQYTIIQIVAGTGIGQVVALTTKSGVRTFNILSGTAPVLLDATSQYTVVGSWRSEVELWLGTAPNALISGRVDANAQATAASLSYNLTGNITGNLSGSVGSVTGAVGSVTGNVGGSVVGDVQGKVLGGGASALTGVGVQADVEQWKATAVAGAIPPDVVFLRSGTAQAGGASTITLDAGASAVNNFYQNEVVFIRSGTGAGQSALITTYNGTTKVATINGTWATNPDATSVFSLLPFGAISASVAGNVTVGGYAAGQDPGTYVLATPAQKLVTNASGFVTFSNTTIATTTNLTNLPSIPTNWLTAAGIAAGALNGKGDWLLASSAPTNFSSLAITVGGAVTAGTVSDKTGYSLTQAFPTNFASLSIDTNGRVELQSGITKNTALNNFEFLLVSSTDHVTPVTGATVTATRSLDGAAFATCANAVTEVGSGIYKINLAATDTNAAIITLKMSASGADTRYITLVTTP